MFIFNIKYQFTDNLNMFWSANILCKENNVNEATNYISEKTRKAINITEASFLCEIHAVSNAVINQFLNQPQEQKPKVEERVIKRRRRRSQAEIQKTKETNNE